MEDKLLIKQVLNGNRQAYAALVDRYQDFAYSIALRVLKNPAEAEEVAQDAFVKAYQHIKRFRGDSKFSTWLYSIVYREAISRARKLSRQPHHRDVEEEESIQDALPDGLESVSQNERTKYIKAALDQLAATDATLISLYYLKELEVQEVAKITGLSEANVKVRLHRARKKLYTTLHQLLRKEIDSLL